MADRTSRRTDPVTADVGEADALEQAQPWDQEEAEEERDELPPDAPEADAAEQRRAWHDERGPTRKAVPPDAPEADVLEQDRPAYLDDDDRY